MTDNSEEIKRLKEAAAKDRATIAYMSTLLFAGKFDWYNIEQCSPPVYLLKKLVMATDPRPAPGVYFLISNTDVVYVGKSSCVISRMVGHKQKQYDRVVMIHEDDCQMIDALERSFIALFKPKYNKSEHSSPMIHPKLPPYKREHEMLLAGTLKEPKHDDYHA